MTRHPARLVVLVVLAATLALSAPQPASGQVDTTADTRPVVDDPNSPAGNILPRPNTGQAPDSPNDPGGWQQYLVFALIIGGLALIAAMVIRESKRARGPAST